MFKCPVCVFTCARIPAARFRFIGRGARCSRWRIITRRAIIRSSESGALRRNDSVSARAPWGWHLQHATDDDNRQIIIMARPPRARTWPASSSYAPGARAPWRFKFTSTNNCRALGRETSWYFTVTQSLLLPAIERTSNATVDKSVSLTNVTAMRNSLTLNIFWYRTYSTRMGRLTNGRHLQSWHRWQWFQNLTQNNQKILF